MKKSLQVKNNDKYFWTEHALMKMKHYGLSEQRVRRVLRNPKRIEEGIVEKTVAVMAPQSVRRVDGKESWKQEIWAMYQIKDKRLSFKPGILGNMQNSKFQNIFNSEKQLKIISVWRYPGVSPKRDPIPEDVLSEIEDVLR